MPLRQHPRSNSPTTFPVVFSPEMVVGVRADRHRHNYPARPGWQVSQQMTHVEAPFGPDMVAGWAPSQHRYIAPAPARQGLSISQTTHVPAPFGQEMAAGWAPSQHRYHAPASPGWSVSQTTHVEAPFSAEMVTGWAPPRHRHIMPARPGWSISQTTHVSAPFSYEMVQGSLARTAQRWDFSPRIGWVAISPDVNPLTPEMFVGYKPDKPRIFLAPRIPLPISQTTDITTPIGPEMVAGSHPDQRRRPVSMVPWVQLPGLVTTDTAAGWGPLLALYNNRLVQMPQ